MQIGTPGGAYGNAAVMSRPTLGRAIRPIPGQPQGALSSALNMARKMPGPTPGGLLRTVGAAPKTRAAVLMNELQRRMALQSHRQAQGGTVDSPEVGGYPAASGAPVPSYGIAAPLAGAADPAAVLARARLAALGV